MDGDIIAYSEIKSRLNYLKNLRGRVFFIKMKDGTIVVAEVQNMMSEERKPAQDFRGFHIHDGNSCTGNQENIYADALGHYNPTDQTHPNHAGDLPPLLFSDGYAWMQVYTGRFRPEDVIGKTVIIHNMQDDFKTQPSGDSGMMIACGEIVPWKYQTGESVMNEREMR